MLARRETLGLIAGGAATLLGGCHLGSSAHYKFRMTVEVETSQGLKSGSSVIEVRVTRGMAIGDSSGISSGVYGEAVVVELPDGPLFVLLKMPNAGQPLQSVVPDALLGRRSDGSDGVMSDTAKLGSTWFSEYRAELPRTRDHGSQASNNNWPMMVRFRNINDPRSVEAIQPEAIGVKRILLETTSDDVTTGIEKRLRWLPSLRGSLSPRLEAPNPSNPLLSAQITVVDFSTEINPGQ
jgi:hypothetical protein